MTIRCQRCGTAALVLLHVPRCATASCRNFDARFAADEQRRRERDAELPDTLHDGRGWYDDRARTHGPI